MSTFLLPLAEFNRIHQVIHGTIKDEGNPGKALQNLAPKAIKDLMAAAEMSKKGYATDAKGRKVVDVGLEDVASKAVGFNPTKVAQQHRKTMPIQQDIALQKRTETAE